MISRRKFLLSSLAASAAAPAFAQSLPRHADPHRRSCRARRRHRHPGPRHEPAARDPVGPDRHRGEPLRRRWADRHAPGHRRRARRPYAADGGDQRHHVARGEQGRASVRDRARLGAGVARFRAALHPGGASGRAGEERRRADRLRQEEPGQAGVWFVRLGRGVASLRRAVRADGRHRHAARAVPRHGPRRAGPARRARSVAVRAGDHRDAADRGGHACA